MPESLPIDDAADGGHAADHAAIDRLASELLPALIAKLGATGLGELEVRQDGWRVRLRRPADAQDRDHADRQRRDDADHQPTYWKIALRRGVGRAQRRFEIL